MKKKYEFTGKTLLLEDKGITLRQIIRIRDGLVGGWIQSEWNLREEGDCFVYDNAEVYDNAVVFGNAEVYGNAVVFGNAEVYDNAVVFGNAEVYDNAVVYGNAEVYDNAVVYGNAEVYDNAVVFGNARVHGDAEVYDNAEVYGNARVHGDELLTNHCDHFTFTEFDITVSDNHLKIGCQRHKKGNWPTVLEGLIKEYDVKHPDVYRFFVNYYCKKGEVTND